MPRPPRDPRLIVLHLRDAGADADDAPFCVRLRVALKVMLRAFGLRCTRIRPAPLIRP